MYSCIEDEGPFADATSVCHGLTTNEGIWPRETPEWPDVLAYYLANGTVIDFSALPVSDHNANLITNEVFDAGLDSWRGIGCGVSTDPTRFQAGVRSCTATRTSAAMRWSPLSMR